MSPMLPRIFPLTRPARFALFYAAFYLGFGAYLPYMPVWFEGRGLSAELIGLAAGAGMAGRVIAAPLAVALANRLPKRRYAILAFTIASLFIFLAHIPAQNPILIVILAGIAGCTVTGMIPIIDAWAVRDSVRRRFAFGPPRAFGSATFIVGNVLGGWLISLYGGEAALYWLLMGCALSVVAAALLPEGLPSVAATENTKLKISSLILAPGLALALAASALLQGAHGFYYGFSTLAWTSTGVPTEAVGLLWATGVGAEIIFFAAMGRYMGGLNPAWLLVFGGVASVVRWLALALAPPLSVLFVLQGLHAFSFGASYFGFLRFVALNVPEKHGATIQAVNSALSGGLVLAGATYASGFAFAQLGAGGFAIMAIPAGLGLVCALKLAFTPSKPAE